MSNERQIFEIHGWFEDIFDVEANKVLGTRTVPADPERLKGYGGRREIWISGKVTLDVGHKKKTFNFKEPRKVQTTLNAICGRMIRP